MTKETKGMIKTVVVLFAFCLIIATLLAVVNYITAPKIAENDVKARLKSLDGLFENAEYVEIENVYGYSTITGIFEDKNSGGFAFTFATTSPYSSGDMAYSIGIDKNGKITGINKISYMESKNFKDYHTLFIDKNQSEAKEIDAYSGVTYSSKAFKNAIEEAFLTYRDIIKSRTGGEV